MDDPGETVPSNRHPLPGGSESTFRLLERIHAGDREAVDALFARFLVPLRRWASGRLPRWARDEADTQDLVQDTLLRAFKKIESFQPQRGGALQAYLRKALLNRITDEVRRIRRRPAREELQSGFVVEAASPLEEAIGREALQRYEAALNRLKPAEREAIIARVEMGCSYDDLAIALNKPTADAARKAAARALVRLAREMHGETT